MPRHLTVTAHRNTLTILAQDPVLGWSDVQMRFIFTGDGSDGHRLEKSDTSEWLDWARIEPGFVDIARVLAAECGVDRGQGPDEPSVIEQLDV